MNLLNAVWSILFGWLPTSDMRIVVAGLFVLSILFIIFRLVKVILGAIPFI